MLVYRLLFGLLLISFIKTDENWHIIQHTFQLPLQNITLVTKSLSGPTRYDWSQIFGKTRFSWLNYPSNYALLGDIRSGYYGIRVLKTNLITKKQIAEIHEIHIYESENRRPKAEAGLDRVIYLPRRSVTLDGSSSTDDKQISSYHWRADPQNPAGLQMLDQSDRRRHLMLTNLVPGDFKFQLTVRDNDGWKDRDTVNLKVIRDPKLDEAIKIRFNTDLGKFTKKNLKHFKRQIYLIIERSIPHIKFHLRIISIHQDRIRGNAILIFFIEYGSFKSNEERDLVRDLDVYPSSQLVKILRPIILDNNAIFPYPIIQINTLDCVRPCYRHGYCDSLRKKCVCDIFWINNLWKTLIKGSSEQDCEWNIFYFLSILVVTFVISTIFIRQLLNFVNGKINQSNCCKLEFIYDDEIERIQVMDVNQGFNQITTNEMDVENRSETLNK